jgi:hypothetical protein
MSFNEWVIAFDQFVPCIGLLWFAMWMHRGNREAQRQIAELVKRLKLLEAQRGVDAVAELSYIAPQPLPSAKARFIK